MTTTTTTTTMTNRPDGHTGYVPKLRYRNAAPSEASGPSDEDKEVAFPTRTPPTSSIREIREALPRSPAALTNHKTAPQPAQQKKKSSLFGGLFVKEPSMAALDIVAAQMTDKHGKIGPVTMPYVSSAKMPQHVPKVNTKWDGVPENVKAKEKELKLRERERQRATTRNSFRPSMNSTSRSAEESGGRPVGRTLSNADSWDSRSSGSRPTFQDNPTRPDSLYSSDSGNSSLPLQQKLPQRPQSFRSPSGSSLPEITAFFPNDIPVAHTLPQRCPSSARSNTQPPGYSDKTGLGRFKSDVPTVLTEPIPEHSASPLTTPIDEFPRTPLALSDDENMDVTMKRRAMVAPAKLSISSAVSQGRRTSMQPIDAFLAGEANPLEISDDEDYHTVSALPSRAKSPTSRYSQAAPIGIIQQDLERRPDSSRARLGLRASMVLPADSAPWESQNTENGAPGSPTSPASPRTKFRLFTKEKP